MVRVQKLVRAIAAASALMSGAAHALSLGEIHLNSALNQPFDATIDLSDVRDLGTSDLRPNLASPDDFSKAGVDRAFFLNDLKFSPEVHNGRTVIRVTSAHPVREPYLNFLLEVNWPSGRILREYTVLLDPPLYSPQAAAAPFVPQVAPPSQAQPRTGVPATPPAPSAGTSPGPGLYTTERRDTLWEIAARNRPSNSVSVDQTMLAIQDLNPGAFIGHNINLMKSGQVLRLPDQAQVQTRSQRQALAEIARQNRAWREGGTATERSTPRRQVDAATQPGADTSAPASPPAQDNLKLLSGQAGEQGAARGQGGDKALADRLAVTQESLDTSRRENEELKGRLGDLQSQLDKLQKIMQLKDAQLARMQASMANPQAAGQPVSPPPAEPGSAPATEAVAPTTATPTPAPTASEAAMGSAPPAAAPAEPKVISVTPSTPATEPTDSTNGLLDDILGNPLWLGLIGGSLVLALLVLLMVNSRRNAVREAEQERELEAARSDSAFDPDPELDEHQSLAGLDLGASAEQAREEEPQDDALGQADIYMAYGRFTQAAEVLKKGSDEEPDRADLRLKLMEVYAEMGDRDGFQREERELKEIGGAQSAVDHLKSRYPTMAAVAMGAAALAAAHELSREENRPAGFSATEDSQDFDLNLDDFDPLDEPAAKPAAADDLAGFHQEASRQQSAKDDFDFDLNFDTEPLAEERPADSPARDDVALDFSEFEALGDEPLGDTAAPQPAEPASAKPAPAEELPADFDLADSAEKPAAPKNDEDEFATRLHEASRQFDRETGGAPTGRGDDLDDFEFLSGEDETTTKLDLARAYMDMGDPEGARDILDEVLAEGTAGQQQEARELLTQLN